MEKRVILQKFGVGILGLLMSVSVVNAQTGVGINDSGSSPDTKAMLDVSSTTKGLLAPRMTTAQRLTLLPNSSPASSQNGMLVYDTNLNAFYYWNNSTTTWTPLLATAGTGLTSSGGTINSSWTINGSNLYNNNSGNIGINNSSATPDTKAILDVSSTTKGVLIPRMTTTQRTAMLPNSVAAASQNGMMVYDTDLSAFYYWNNSTTSWAPMLSAAGTGVTTSGGTINTSWTINGNNIYNNNPASVGINNSSPDAKAALDVASTTKGILIPRMTTTQRTTLLPNGVAAAAQNGMMVYDTDLSTFYYWNNPATSWSPLLNSTGSGATSTGGTVSTSWTISGNNVYNNNTANVGINATSPAQKLTVGDGNILVSNTTGTAGAMMLQGTGTGKTTIKAGAQGTTDIAYTLPTALPTADGFLSSTNTGSTSWINFLTQSGAFIGGVKFLNKPIDQGLTGSNTLQNDNHLVVDMGAAQTWEISGLLHVTTTGNGNFKMAFTVPTGSTMKITYVGYSGSSGSANTSGSDLLTTSGVSNYYINVGAGSFTVITFQGFVTTSTTPGNLQLQWAQNTVTANTVTVGTNSYIRATRVK